MSETIVGQKRHTRRMFLRSTIKLGTAVALLTPNTVQGMLTKVGPIRSIPDFMQAVSFARLYNRAALIDVGADWCEFCHVLDAKIFPDPRVAAHLARLALIRVDVTSMSPANIDLLNYLNVAGPPTLFLIDTSSGEELPNTRSVGPFDVEDLADRLRPYAA